MSSATWEISYLIWSSEAHGAILHHFTLFFKIQFNVIQPSTLNSSKWFLTITFVCTPDCVLLMYLLFVLHVCVHEPQQLSQLCNSLQAEQPGYDLHQALWIYYLYLIQTGPVDHPACCSVSISSSFFQEWWFKVVRVLRVTQLLLMPKLLMLLPCTSLCVSIESISMCFLPHWVLINAAWNICNTYLINP
jgi:hypothetical protein